MQGRSIKQIIIGLLLIGFGNYIYYLFGYRQLFLVNTCFLVTVIIGWVVFKIGFVALLQPVKQSSINITNINKPVIIIRWSGCFAQLILVLVLVGNFIGILLLSEQRVAHILATQPTKQTTATVVDTYISYTKSSRTPHATVVYNTDKERITQEMPDGYRSANMGETFNIKYSVEYPHMIEVIP